MKINKWFWLGVLGTVLGAPNGTVIRFTTANFDPIYFTFLRFAVTFLATLPFLIISSKKMNLKSVKYSLLAGVAFFVAVISFTEAIKLSAASYASLITLITPAFFISYSVKLNNEKISRRAMAGIILSAAGAFIMIFLPIAIKQNADLQIYPLATVLLLMNCITYPLAAITVKKANDEGAPMVSIISISSAVIAVMAGLFMIVDKPSNYSVEPKEWLAVAFSGLVVAIIARIASIKSYEHIGSVVSSALGYLGNFLSILIPVIVLGEKLSVEMVAGGFVILLGIYVLEHHKSEHHKHFHGFIHH